MVLSWNTNIVCSKTAEKGDEEGGLIDPNSVQTCIYESSDNSLTYNLNPLNRISGKTG